MHHLTVPHTVCSSRGSVVYGHIHCVNQPLQNALSGVVARVVG